jgi:hypothetical protein
MLLQTTPAPTAAPPEPEQAPANTDTTTQTEVPTPTAVDPTPSPPIEPVLQPPRPKPNYPIFISEILADPPSGLSGDANRDGRRDTYQDEFVELHNTGPTAISLAGWRLGDDDIKTDAYFRFPDDGRIGNGLTNSGDRLLLLDAAADTVLDFTFTGKSNINQSLVRKNNQYQLHSQLPGRGLYSPGQAQTEYTSFAIPDPQLIEGDTHNLTLVGHHPIGLDTLTAKDFQWLSVDPHIAQIRPNAKIRGLRPGHTRLECWRDALFLAQQLIRVHPFEPPNDPPQITSQPDTTAFANGWYRYAVSATDPEHNTLVFTFAQAPRWLDLDNLSGL